MSANSSKTILFIDYENVQNLDFSSIQLEDIEVKIFVGQSQNKIPFELVQSIQGLGHRVEWIKIEGSGNNSLDFHIAFYLGRVSNNLSNSKFIVLSKDKGFDPLISYLKKQNIQCSRIEEISKLQQTNKTKSPNHQNTQNSPKSTDTLISKIINHLSKITQNSRPKTRSSLRQYIKSLLRSHQLGEKQIDAIIETLFSENKLSEVSNRLVYQF